MMIASQTTNSKHVVYPFFLAEQVPFSQTELDGLVEAGILGTKDMPFTSDVVESVVSPQPNLRVYYFKNSSHSEQNQHAWSALIERKQAELKAEATFEAHNATWSWKWTDIKAKYDEHIHRLHEYNDLKDIGQMVIGKLAMKEGTLVSTLYPDFGLELTD